MKTELWSTAGITLSSLDIQDQDQMVILAASALDNKHVPSFPPSLAALILDLKGCADLTNLQNLLYTNYSPQQTVTLIFIDPVRREVVRKAEIPLAELAETSNGNEMIHLFIPALEELTAFEAFQEVVARLRAPDGCPWDQKQTHLTLRSHLLSETYEVLSALDAEDAADMCEEFGDLLLQIVLHAQIASEAGEFQMKDIVQGIHRKIVHRHPHVFGDVQLDDEKGVLQNWERLKAAERAAKQNLNARPEKPKGMLDGVPLALPALVQAQEYFERVERVGIAWLEEREIVHGIADLAKKISRAEEPTSDMMRLVFLTANLASIHHLDAEGLLREANGRIRSQVQAWEERARTNASTLSDSVTKKEIRSLWELDKNLQESESSV